MEIRILIVLFSLLLTSPSWAQNCSLNENQINQLKNALYCRAEESLRACQQITGIGLSPDSVNAGDIGSGIGATQASELWKSNIKLCKVPGFSGQWYGYLVGEAFAKTAECVVQDAYLEKLFDKINPEVEKTLRQNIESVSTQAPSFLSDEKQIRKTMGSNLGAEDVKKVQALAQKFSLTTADVDKLKSLGLSSEKISDLVEFQKKRLASLDDLNKLAGQHREMVRSLNAKASLSPTEAKAYIDLVNKIPNAGTSASLSTKLHHFQITALSKAGHVLDKVNAVVTIQERLEKELLKDAVALVSRRAAAHVIPVMNLYATAKDGADAAGVVYDVYVNSTSACSQTFSKFTPVDENCQPIKGKHPLVLKFLSESWKVQNQALNGYAELCENMKSIHQEYVKPPYKVSCNANGFVADPLDKSKKLQIRGFKNAKGNLERLVFDERQFGSLPSSSRIFAATYNNGEPSEMRYLQLSTGAAARYNAAALTSYADDDEKFFDEIISNFSDSNYYRAQQIKTPDSRDSTPANITEDLKQIHEHNFYVTEILGCCDKEAARPGAQRCREYGIQRLPSSPRQQKSGPANL